VADTRMTVRRGATYRRRITWPRPDDPSLYSAQLVLRKRLDDPVPFFTLAITPTGVPSAVQTYVKIGPTQTSGLPVGSTFWGAVTLTTIADATENWVFSFPVTVEATAAAAGP
jgi:hypothetical protein